MYNMRGFTVMTSVWVPKTVWVKRNWKERLFTLPWRPLQKMKEEPGVYIINNTVYCHPDMYAQILDKFSK